MYHFVTLNIKAAVHFLGGLKMIQNPYLRKCLTSQCSKWSACHSLIQSGTLVIMFLIPVVLVNIRGRFEHVITSHLYT